MLYQRSLFLFEAMEINEQTELEVRKWAGFDTIVPSPVLEPAEYNLKGVYWQVHTPAGIKTCIPGDFIFKTSDRKFYCVSRDVFLESFVPFPVPAGG